MEGSVAPQWLILAVRVPAEPTRHRVAVWRELRRLGALLLNQGTWAVPDVAGVSTGIARAVQLAVRGGGEILVLQAHGQSDQDAKRLEELFTAARQDEWSEFIADCGKFDVEIDKEIRIEKFTVAELEEEEQSLDRLKRWHEDIRARDVFGAGAGDEADRMLARCQQRLAEYTHLVFEAAHQM